MTLLAIFEHQESTFKYSFYHKYILIKYNILIVKKMAYLELEDIINSLDREAKKEKSLRNKCLYDSAIKALNELKVRKINNQ